MQNKNLTGDNSLIKKACFTPAELAVRWNLKETTLSQWRWFGHGPTFLKLGAHIAYQIKDIEEFENLGAREIINKKRALK